MSKEQQTVKLNNGVEVTAKILDGNLFAITYCNRTQATRAAEKLGAGWMVFQSWRSMVFYVAKN